MRKIEQQMLNAIESKRNWSLDNTLAQYRDWETDRKSTRLNSSHRL